MKQIVLACAVLLGLAGRAFADEPQAAFRLESSDPHAGMPFNLILIVVGFDETPTPELPKLAIPGAKVTPLGAQPRVSQAITDLNGHRSITKSVEWHMRYRVEVATAGRIQIPTTTATQGSKKP